MSKRDSTKTGGLSLREILKRSFSSDQYEQEFWGAGAFGTTNDDPGEQAQVLRERTQNRINVLESIMERLDLFDEKTSPTPNPEEAVHFSRVMHPAIDTKCRTLFETAHYAQAIELSFKVVRDRLRALTGQERGADAFGKTKLHIKGALAAHVDHDFNEGVKFLTMAIDMFRNEKSHTSEAGVDDPTKALQYLVLSSLAMRFLDNAEMRP